MNQKALLYNGKSKQIFATEGQNFVIMSYKDDETAYYGVKKSTIPNKGALNNKISSLIFEYLEKNGIYTHFVEQLDENKQLCRRATSLPLEFIVRNVIAGTLSRRLDIEEGTVPESTIYEICLKSDILRDPLINHYHVVALGYAKEETLVEIRDTMQKINELLSKLLKSINIDLIDFKVEFGYDTEGKLMLIDEISPDTARFWDSESHEHLDRDLFRRDLGDIESAYKEVLTRLESALKNG
ncbi:MAG: phosphoribosylaminoimidazolesuccinocarboxamide synthase [Bacteroidales bacterium]|jgi:phosphoribosylaminoimidazole-succinocarboxamide synthase|nr:phosphoribosylaminoimidazolesuccinocarboxamide synthase [Bacteroidales bacterium]